MGVIDGLMRKNQQLWSGLGHGVYNKVRGKKRTKHKRR